MIHYKIKKDVLQRKVVMYKCPYCGAPASTPLTGQQNMCWDCCKFFPRFSHLFFFMQDRIDYHTTSKAPMMSARTIPCS